MTQTNLLYSEFKSLIVSLASDYILKIKNLDERKRKIKYMRLRESLQDVCKFTNASEVEERYYYSFCSTLKEFSVSAPDLYDFHSILRRSTPNEHHEWKTGNMYQVVVGQVQTRLGDEFPSNIF